MLGYNVLKIRMLVWACSSVILYCCNLVFLKRYNQFQAQFVLWHHHKYLPVSWNLAAKTSWFSFNLMSIEPIIIQAELSNLPPIPRQNFKHPKLTVFIFFDWVSVEWLIWWESTIWYRSLNMDSFLVFKNWMHEPFWSTGWVRLTLSSLCPLSSN